MVRDKMKAVWSQMTTLDKVLVCIRDIASVCFLLFALLHVLKILTFEAVAWFLPVIAIAQALLSWKRSKATSVFFLFALVFFLFVFYISKG